MLRNACEPESRITWVATKEFVVENARVSVGVRDRLSLESEASKRRNRTLSSLRGAVLVLAMVSGLAIVTPRLFGQAVDLPEAPQASTPFTLTAVTDSAGRSQFRYQGKDIPPTMRVRPGQTLQVEYVNHLAPTSREKCAVVPCTDRSNLHFHGLHVSPDAGQDDVLTMSAAPGQTLKYSVQVPLDQPPGLYWYHTHPHGESYRQGLDGMSGAIVVEGIDRYVPELRRMQERIMVLRDAELDAPGVPRAAILQRVAMQAQTCGKAVGDPERAFTVNGVVRPQIEIAPGERQFWRVVNASPDLYADVEIPGSRLEVVALDGMPFAFHDPAVRTRSFDHVLLSPGGRMEAIVTGPSAAKPIVFQTRCVDTGADGDPNPAMVLADLVPRPAHEPVQALVKDSGRPVHENISQAKLSPVEQAEPHFTVVFTEDKHGFYINNHKFMMMDPPMVTEQVGFYRHWRVVNNTNEVHPFHIHQVHFLVYQNNGKPLSKPEWLDTVNVEPRGSVDLVMDFTDPIIRGMSVFHCHLLSHEDKGMMAKIEFR
jgi:suppressor of ftsI